MTRQGTQDAPIFFGKGQVTRRDDLQGSTFEGREKFLDCFISFQEIPSLKSYSSHSFIFLQELGFFVWVCCVGYSFFFTTFIEQPSGGSYLK